jgi:peroxiredoxin
MAQFEPLKQEIEKNGNLVFIAAQRRGGLVADPEKHFKDHPVAFPYLLDEDRSVTKAYGVYKRLGIDSVNIAKPATFIIGRDGKVRFIYVGRDQLDRAPIDKVMEAFRAAS